MIFFTRNPNLKQKKSFGADGVGGCGGWMGLE